MEDCMSELRCALSVHQAEALGICRDSESPGRSEIQGLAAALTLYNTICSVATKQKAADISLFLYND